LGTAFQFLIGRLKTQFTQELLSDPNSFQFLIGRLKTLERWGWKTPVLPFQFLIGRLKTELQAFLSRP